MPAASKLPYRMKDLLRRGVPKRYRGAALAQIAFPLGGAAVPASWADGALRFDAEIAVMKGQVLRAGLGK